MTHLMTGGCQCGRIRFSAAIHDDEAYLCHCNYCRRATGGVAAAFRNIRQADVTWTTRPPDWYRSSEIAERPFCAACGTPLGFRFVEGSETMDLTIGAFDDPGFFRPTSNFSVETKLAAWEDTSHLPGKRLDEHPATVERWINARGKLPD